MNLLRRGEYHRFDADGAPYVYLVPSAAIFRLDDPSVAVLDALGDADIAPDTLVGSLVPRFEAPAVQNAIGELLGARAIRSVAAPVEIVKPALPKKRIPLTTLVLNVTSKCNLACTYCYEYGEDRVVEPSKKPRFMTEETARQSVDFMFAEAGEQKTVHLTFFGGETLLNYKVLRSALTYARERAAALGKEVDVSLTTNATLLRDEIIDWIVDNDVGVTVSIDGDREQQNRHRVFHNGKGSYDVIRPHIESLLTKHRRRPVGARVTLTHDNLDVIGIFRHLRGELGFWEVGFAPVTT
ncbi:MAG: radical SAM protein, partial [Gemmatimonadaceae bacterium]